MAAPNEADYRRWKESIFGSDFDIWHDGLDTAAAQSLEGEPRENGVLMLLFGVKTGDSHAATALAAMGETGAVPDIRTALTTASGDHKVRFASAIHNLSPEDSSSNSMSRELIEVLEKTDSPWSTRITAAIGLKDFGDAASEQALLKAVENDNDYLVRYHSCDSLLLRWGVEPPQISSHSDIFKLICDPREGDAIMDLPTRGREAVVLLEKLHNRDG